MNSLIIPEPKLTVILLKILPNNFLLKELRGVDPSTRELGGA